MQWWSRKRRKEKKKSCEQRPSWLGNRTNVLLAVNVSRHALFEYALN